MTDEFVFGIKVPAASTLHRYGLTTADWYAILATQAYVCGVCQEKPKNGVMPIDHQHVRGWKKMPSEERRKYVRGLCCITCNHFVLTRYGTTSKFRNAARYLERYAAWRLGWVEGREAVWSD